MPTTVLALAPHPDDAEWYAGGAIAKMIGAGARVFIVIATDGRRGSFELDGETLIRVRAEEARRAAVVLGAEPPLLLGHPDLELDRLPPGHLREQFVRLIRQHRPEVVFAPDSFRPDLHPDHRAVAWAAAEALAFAQLPLLHPEHLAEGLAPHFVTEKYFHADDPAGANRVVDIGAAMDKKLAALAEHKTQMQFLAEDALRQARLAGLDLRAMFSGALDDPMAAITYALQAQAGEAGQKIGVQFGEAFRYERFHPLVEALLAANGTSAV